MRFGKDDNFSDLTKLKTNRILHAFVLCFSFFSRVVALQSCFDMLCVSNDINFIFKYW